MAPLDCTRSLRNQVWFLTFLYLEGLCGDEVLGLRPWGSGRTVAARAGLWQPVASGVVLVIIMECWKGWKLQAGGYRLEVEATGKEAV